MNYALIPATALLFLVLIQPNHPGAMTWGALWVFPLELPAIVFALLAARGTFLRILRVSIVAILTLIAVLKAADLVSFDALSRGFNPVADLALIDAFARLLAGAIGPVLATLVMICACLAIVLLGWLLWWATGQWARIRLPRPFAPVLIFPAILASALVAFEVGQIMGRWSAPVSIPGTAFTARVGVERIELIRRTVRELADLRAEIEQDPFTGATDLLDKIDRDVLVIYVESYGRTSLDTPFYASVHRETLEKYETRLGDLGLSMQSGFLNAPTRGGQSWLSHATIANGLWIDNQVRYRAAISSGRETLFHHAANNGFRTAAIMPQITLDWPESFLMGFDEIFAAADLQYAGLPFNWVTMPDQFTLTALDRHVRNRSTDQRLFAQIALSSSHAPWVPVPTVISWDDVGDGTVFNEMAQSGDPPEVVWRDRDRVRAQYRLAIDYSLSAVFEYAALHAEDPPLMIVIGDHQAAQSIALDARSDVPIHVVGPQDLVAHLSQVAPVNGLLANDTAPVIPMNTLRDIILNVYSSRTPTGTNQ